MAKRIGDELWAAGEAVTKREEVQKVIKKCLVSRACFVGFLKAVYEKSTVTS